MMSSHGHTLAAIEAVDKGCACPGRIFWAPGHNQRVLTVPVVPGATPNLLEMELLIQRNRTGIGDSHLKRDAFTGKHFCMPLGKFNQKRCETPAPEFGPCRDFEDVEIEVLPRGE